MKRIMFYYHHYGGLGHGTRIAALTKSVKKRLPSSEIVVVCSGMPQPELGLGKMAKIIQLPPYVSESGLFHGIKTIDGEKDDLEKIKRERKQMLLKVFSLFNPDFLVIEHFPFGRKGLDYELVPLIKLAKKGGKAKVIASIRDLISINVDIKRLEENCRSFDAILVHSDPDIFKIEDEFNLSNEVKKKIVYTGYVTCFKKQDLISPQKIRKQLGLGKKRLIVASAGSGMDGFEFLKNILNAKEHLDKETKSLLLVSTGPQMNEKQRKELKKIAKGLKGVQFTEFNPNLVDYVNAADLSVSMGGYNSCMNALITGTPTVIFPRSSDNEQVIRSKKLEQLHLSSVCNTGLNEKDLADFLMKLIVDKSNPNKKRNQIDIKGAELFANFIALYGSLQYAKIRLSVGCNCECDMCTWVLSKNGKIIPKSKVLEMLDQLTLIGAQHVNFTGGEPTLRDDITDLIKEGKKRGFYVSISSNGLFSKGLAGEMAASGLDAVDFSLDAADPAIHDNIRGKKGCWQACVSNMELFSKEYGDIKLLINFTLRNDNFRESKKMLELAQGLGVDTISFSTVNTDDNPKDISHLAMNFEQLEEFYLEILPGLLLEAEKKNIDIKVSPFFKGMENLPRASQAMNLLLIPKFYSGIITKRMINRLSPSLGNPCNEVQHKIRIDHLGSISPCCTFDENSNKLGLGNVFKQNIVNIWLSPRYTEFRESICNKEFCKVNPDNFC
jgi:predicted glycosyltransferase